MYLNLSFYSFDVVIVIVVINRKNKFLIFQTGTGTLFLYKYFLFFQNQNTWYDDAHELLISRVAINDLESFLLIADHHIGFSLFLKLLIGVFGFEYIYVVFGCLNLLIFLVLGYLIAKQDNFSYEICLVQILILSSPIVVDYIYRPKQYFIDFCIAVLLIRYFSKESNLKLKKIFSALFFSVFFSNILVIYFIFPLMRLISNNKNKLSILLLTLIPIPFFYRAYTKFFNDEFREYWSIYYENSSASLVKLFFNNLMFIRNFNDLGFLPLLSSIIFIGVLLMFRHNRIIFWMTILPVLILNFLNLINLYPIGAGRTDLILFPFFVYCFLNLFKYLNTKFSITFLLIALLPVFIFVENKNIREDNTQEILEYSQSFEYDLLYVTYYSIPQTILFDNQIGQAKLVNGECFYNSKSKNIVFMQSELSKGCEPQTDFTTIQEQILENKKILIIGHDSKTQNIQYTILNIESLENSKYIKEFGNNEFLIAINFDN